MKEVKDMTNDELIKYCIDKKKKGVSYREFSNIFEKNNIDKETIKLIMSKLNDIDKLQKAALLKLEKAQKKKTGIKNLIIGLLIVIFGFILFASSAKAGVIFIFNFVVWGFGALLILRGLLNIIAGFVNND